MAEGLGDSADGALQSVMPPMTIPSTQANFEGLSNQDNANIFGFRVNPPDPNGEAGPNNYIEMINLVFAIYDKSGNLQLGPVDTGTLWSGFSVPDCTDPSGDPVVMYDQFRDQWILTQFTTRGPRLELRRDLHHRRSDRLLLPLRLLDGPELPGLPEVRELEGLLRHHHRASSARRSSTGSASTPSRRTR